jgi:hypothetical protein
MLYEEEEGVSFCFKYQVGFYQETLCQITSRHYFKYK